MNASKCKSIKRDEFKISRTFDVPRDVLWKTLTSERWKSWWLPKKYKLYDAELYDGGKYYGCMEQSDGKDFCVKGKFLKVIPNEEIIMKESFSDRESIVAPADYYGSRESWPAEMYAALSFDDIKGGSKLTLRHYGLKGYDCTKIEESWNNFFNELYNEINKEIKGEFSKIQHEETGFRE